MTPNMKTYTLSTNDLAKLFSDVLKMCDEFEHVHGYDHDRAQAAAVVEILDGLAATDEIREFEAAHDHH